MRQPRGLPIGALMRVLLATIAISVAGCGDSRVVVDALPDDAVILAFGDSITHGTGAGRGEDYPSQLAAMTGYTVINAGVPGETTDRGLLRLPALLDQHRPDLVVLCHGGNDILRNLSESEAESNLRLMIESIRASGAQVLLLGVPRKSLFLDTAPVYARIAGDMEVALLDEVVRDVLRDSDLKSDAVHPNAAGYRRIAEHLAREIGS